MPGVPGSGGPVPKRRKLGHRSKAEKEQIVKAPGAATVERPKPNSRWHPAAKRWYSSLDASGQSRWYQPSDWALAYIVAESLSRDLRDKVVGVNDAGPITAKLPISGASLSSYLKAMTALLVTEGDRRRARIELEQPEGGGDGEGAAGVSWLAEARRGRQSG